MQNEKLSGYQDLNNSSPLHGPDGFRSKAKAKAKRLIKIAEDSSLSEDNEEDQYVDAVAEEINQSAAFDADKVLNTSRLGNVSRIKRTKTILQGTAAAITHPIASIKSKATRKTAGKLAKSRPYLSNQADLDFLEAHDDLHQARDAQNTSDDEDAIEENLNNIDHYEKKVHTIERSREEMRVAWVTDRHVHRVRVVDKIPPPFPSDQYFEQQNDQGFTEFNWGEWVGYKLLHGSHNFTAQYVDDFEELPQFSVAGVYIGYQEDLQYAYIVYATAMNYYYPSSVAALRDEFSRNIDRGATALKAGELMGKHGNKDWLGPLLEQLGPYLQVQIADLANLLEVYDNFFHFRRSQYTFYSLFLFVAVFLLSAFASIQFTMNVFWFVVGLVFFGCWPISSLHPRYRLLVSPLKWAFWDIPTHPEWSLQYLQNRGSSALLKINTHASENLQVRVGTSEASAEATGKIEKHFQTISSTDIDGGHDIISFGCTFHHVPGRLIISTKTLRFEALVHSIMPCESFNEPYSELIEMSKQQTEDVLLASLAKMTIGKDKLELKFRGARGSDLHNVRQNKHMVVLLENMRRRDKAFNSIIAFSGVRWQCLQKTSKKVGGQADGKEKANPSEYWYAKITEYGLMKVGSISIEVY
ncbi:hypothetical protein EYC80_010310 [Monilinia laxa]|uniref:Uncharacterized protein n=1 Tax=Monilinia laxa TaxID=61186 RepID=A0A5N6JR98_MONLA|nr:hypothetical protein EYC80_010310 [Monilinia laxa]